MIPRYAPADAATLFSDEARLGRWLEVELLTVEALARSGVAPQAAAAAVRARAPKVDGGFVEAVSERERATDHDVAAFVDVVQERIGQPEGSWIHFGLTSSDVVDTAQCVALTQAADLLIEAADGLIAALVARARELRAVPVAGRTHGMAAEPTTFGAKFALWALQVDRDRQRLVSARRRVAVGKLSGAVGTYSNIEPEIETYVCRALGLEPVPATQVIARDRHAEYLYACTAAGSTVELIATEIRHLARTEVGEVEEPFGAEQKGSSAMPHKRNPILSERLCGLARVLRGYLVAGLEDVALWHERDISHSSVERIVLPDATALDAVPAAQGDRPRVRAGRPRRPGARQPDQPVPRPRVQPVGAAGAGGSRVHPRRGLPHRPARRPGGLGVQPPASRGAGRRRRGDAQRTSAGGGVRP